MNEELRIGAMAIKQGIMTPRQVNICLEIQAKLRAYGVDMPLGEVAVRRGFIRQEQLEALLRAQTAPPDSEQHPLEEQPQPFERRPRLSALPRGVVNAFTALSVLLCLGIWGVFLYRAASPVKKIVVKTKFRNSSRTEPASVSKPPSVHPPTTQQDQDFNRLKKLFETCKEPKTVLTACENFRKKYPKSKYIKEIQEMEKVCRERLQEIRQEHIDKASKAFVDLVSRVLKLRSEERLQEAVETLMKYPREFRDTEYWDKIQRQIRSLREQIGRRYADDLEELKACLARGDLEGAEKLVEKVSRYAGEAVGKQLRKRIEAVRKRRRRKLTPEEAVAQVKTLFETHHYAEALKVAQRYLASPETAKRHKIDVLLARLKAIERLYRLVALHYQMNVGKKMELTLWPGGRVRMRLEDVRDFTLFGRDEAGLVVRVGIGEIAGDVIEAIVAKETSPSAEIELALAQMWLDREDDRKAREHLERARKLGASPQLLAALNEKLPQKQSRPERTSFTLTKARELIKGRRFGQALDMLREFMRRASDDLKKSAETLIKICRKNLRVAENPFSVELLRRSDLGRGFCEVTYDFSSAEQLNDWKEYNWFSVFDLHDSQWRLEGGVLRGSGCRGFLWKGYVQGDVIVEFDAVALSRTQPNIQVTICDDGKGENYLFGAGLVELGPAQDVIRFNQRYGMPRTIAKRPSPIVAFRKYHIRVEKRGSRLLFFIDGKKVLEARATALKGGHIGLFAAGGIVHFDNVRIVGRLLRKLK